MLFSSIPFVLYFFPVVFIVHYLLFFSRKLQNLWLLLASLFFYAWGEPRYVFLMIGSILFNSFFALVIEKCKNRKRRTALVIAVSGNLLALFAFKYLGFCLNIFGFRWADRPKTL